MKTKITYDIKSSNKLGSFRLGLILADVIIKDGSKQLWDEIELVTTRIIQHIDLFEINQNEIISAARQAYKKCGNDPNRYRPSADSLLRRIVKGQGLYKVNNVVDVLNYISIQTGYSIGGYDFTKIKLPIELSIGLKNEPYRGIGRGDLNINNLPVLRDVLGAFGTPTSDSERTMISTKTSTILMVFYDFDFHDSLEPVLQKTKSYLVKYCSARNISTEILKFP